MSDAIRQSAKKYLLKNHVYKITAQIMGVVGFGIFVYFYVKFIDGHPGILVKEPVLILIMIFPFIPSVVLLFLSKKARRNAGALIATLKSPSTTQS